MDLDAVVQAVLSAQQAALPWTPAPEPLTGAPVGLVAAVDGSHAVLVDNGVFWAVAVRAVAIKWPGRPVFEVPMVIHATLPKDAVRLVERDAARLGVMPPSSIRSAEAFAEELRALAELEAALEVLGQLEADDVLLIDGAILGLPERQQAVADRMRAAAERRGVAVLGVSKRSGLAAGGVPIVPRVQDAVQLEGPWAVPVPEKSDVWIVRLHAASPWAFRVDGPRASLEALVPLARDAGYLGYPYPLAAAHNAVAITRDQALAAADRIESALRVAGADLRWWNDFHGELDRNVPG